MHCSDSVSYQCCLQYYYVLLVVVSLQHPYFFFRVSTILCLILQFIVIREKKENKTEYMLEYFLPRIEHFIHFEIMGYLDTPVRT